MTLTRFAHTILLTWGWRRHLIAFICAANQFVPLLGENGLLPVSRYVRAVAFRDSPSLFYWVPRDVAFTAAAWVGIVLSCLVITGIASRYSWSNSFIFHRA